MWSARHRTGPVARFGKYLSHHSILFSIHGKNPSADSQRLQEAMAELSGFPRDIKHIYDAQAFLLSSQSPDCAYMISFDGSFMFEHVNDLHRRNNQHETDVTGAFATSMWELHIYDPRASAVPGERIDLPCSFSNPLARVSFHASLPSASPLPVFTLVIVRNRPHLGHILNGMNVPFAQNTQIANIRIHGTLEKRHCRVR